MKRITRRQFTGMLVAGAASTLPIAARTQGGGKVTLYMGPPEKTCTAITQGFETPVAGVFRHEGVPLMHYLYADARAHLGHYLEFMYQTEAGRDLFAQVPRF